MLKRILHDWHRYVLWALLSALIWAWIFSLVTRAPASKKVQLFAELPAMRGEALEIALEREKPDVIAYVQAEPFDYAMIDQTEVLYGDLYLIPESKAETYLASFAKIDRTLFPDASFYESGGNAYGILVYDEETGLSVGGEYVAYLPGERCYLFFRAESQHLGAWNDSPDDAAIRIAQNYLNLSEDQQ